MYNTMVKLRNKKAFTLVEMMAVIAIVAVLVAVVVPIIGNSTTKARAATNAANLRSVEGQLSTARVSDPDLFITVTDEFGQFVTQLDQFKNLVGVIDFTGGFGWVLEQLGVDASTKLSAYKMCHFTDDDKDGVIEIATRDGEHSYKLNNVPLSVAVNAGGTPGMTVLEGTPMTIWISENGFVATYETTGGAYVSANFAEVAETGEFNSTPSGGDTLVELECASGHVGPFTDNGDGKTHTCTHCGEKELTHNLSKTTKTYKIGQYSFDVTYPVGDGKCDDGCGYVCDHDWKPYKVLNNVTVGVQCSKCSLFTLGDAPDSSECSHDWNASTGECNLCGKTCTHRFGYGQVAGIGTAKDTCTTCGYVCKHSCGWKQTDNGRNHMCEDCNVMGDHTYSSTDGFCTADGCNAECGHSSHSQDGFCSTCHKSVDHDWNGKTGKCKICGAECPYKDSHSSDSACEECGYQEESSGGGGCVTPETLITLADGTQKQVQHLTGEELLLVWNLETGSYDAAPVAYIVDHGREATEYEVITLTFSNGKSVEIVEEHVFYDYTLNRYIGLRSDNVDAYIGHTFAAESCEKLELTELVQIEREMRVTEIYEVVSYKHMSCFTNSILSASAYLDQLLNIFEIDQSIMAYDAVKVQSDIETYGLYTYEDFDGLIPEEAFDMYNAAYVKIAIEKGELSWNDIENLVSIYYGVDVEPLQ